MQDLKPTKNGTNDALDETGPRLSSNTLLADGDEGIEEWVSFVLALKNSTWQLPRPQLVRVLFTLPNVAVIRA